MTKARRLAGLSHSAMLWSMSTRLPARYSYLMSTLHQCYDLEQRGRAYLELARLAFESDHFPNHIHLAVSHLATALRCARLARDSELFDAARGFRDAAEPFVKDHPYMRGIDLVLNESWLSQADSE